MAAATLTPASGLDYSRAYGGIPQIPDPFAEATAAITGGISAASPLYKLATGAGAASAAGQQAQYIGNLPDYLAMTQTASGNILANLRGQVPPDVWNMIQQRGAERGIATGQAGSPVTNTAMLRALGLTSLDLQKLGQSQLTAAIQRTPTGPAFDPSKFMVTPEQSYEAQLYANLLRAAPVPSAAVGAGIRLADLGMQKGGATPFYPGPVGLPGTTPGTQPGGVPTGIAITRATGYDPFAPKPYQPLPEDYPSGEESFFTPEETAGFESLGRAGVEYSPFGPSDFYSSYFDTLEGGMDPMDFFAPAQGEVGADIGPVYGGGEDYGAYSDFGDYFSDAFGGF